MKIVLFVPFLVLLGCSNTQSSDIVPFLKEQLQIFGAKVPDTEHTSQVDIEWSIERDARGFTLTMPGDRFDDIHAHASPTDIGDLFRE